MRSTHTRSSRCGTRWSFIYRSVVSLHLYLCEVAKTFPSGSLRIDRTFVSFERQATMQWVPVTFSWCEKHTSSMLMTTKWHVEAFKRLKITHWYSECKRIWYWHLWSVIVILELSSSCWVLYWEKRRVSYSFLFTSVSLWSTIAAYQSANFQRVSKVYGIFRIMCRQKISQIFHDDVSVVVYLQK